MTFGNLGKIVLGDFEFESATASGPLRYVVSQQCSPPRAPLFFRRVRDRASICHRPRCFSRYLASAGLLLPRARLAVTGGS